MNDPFGLLASGLPPELVAQYSGLTQQQAIAQALLQQSQTPLHAPETKGRFQGRVSPLEGVAKIVQAYMGRQGLNEANQGMAGIASGQERARQAEMDAYQKTARGVPGVTPLTPNDDEGNPMPSVAAVPGNRQAAVEAAMLSRIPAMRQFGQGEQTALHRAEDITQRGLDRKADTDARLAQAKMLAEQAAAARAAEAEARRAAKVEADARAADLRRELAANRPERAEPAPSVRDILDPLDPTKLISVDTRKYNEAAYKAGDKTGVIGVAGKEPTAAKKEEQVGQGRETVSNLVTQLRDYYDQLDKGGGITNPDKGLVSNVTSGIQSSGVGQFVGKLAGTDNQSARNSIAQQRPLLLNAIKQATGMSAKQMDSNAELKMYLAAATDPTLDVKANKQALDMLDRLYGLSGGAKGKEETKSIGGKNYVKRNGQWFEE